jgi:D-Tyr-tRNAtyr deacylase
MQTSTLINSGTTAFTTPAAVVLEDGEAATLSFIGTGKVTLVSVTNEGTEQDEDTLLSSKARSVQVFGPLRFKLRRNVCEAPVGVRMFRS